MIYVPKLCHFPSAETIAENMSSIESRISPCQVKPQTGSSYLHQGRVYYYRPECSLARRLVHQPMRARSTPLTHCEGGKLDHLVFCAMAMDHHLQAAVLMYQQVERGSGSTESVDIVEGGVEAG